MPDNKTNQTQPILVTGAHRSGTTWVGKMLTASGEAAYISEPLNHLHRPGVLDAPVPYWYFYITESNQAIYHKAFEKTLNFDYQTWEEIKSLRSIKDIGRMNRDRRIFHTGKSRGLRPLLKDPFAVFSAPWFAATWNSKVVITVRHPAGFASSIKRLHWDFDFGDLLNQPMLIHDLLEPFENEIRKQAAHPADIISQAILLWRVIYSVVVRYRNQYPDFFIVRNEDLSRQPLDGFQAIYDHVDLTLTPQAKETILASTSNKNPVEAPKKSIYATQLDSQAAMRNWKHRLTTNEIDRIYNGTKDIASHFYTDDDWV
jgi:hypothetical protein